MSVVERREDRTNYRRYAQLESKSAYGLECRTSSTILFDRLIEGVHSGNVRNTRLSQPVHIAQWLRDGDRRHESGQSFVMIVIEACEAYVVLTCLRGRSVSATICD